MRYCQNLFMKRDIDVTKNYYFQFCNSENLIYSIILFLFSMSDQAFSLTVSGLSSRFNLFIENFAKSPRHYLLNENTERTCTCYSSPSINKYTTEKQSLELKNRKQ